MLPKAETRHPVRDLRGSVSAASKARPAKPDAPLDVGVMFGKLFAEQCVAIREQRQKIARMYSCGLVEASTSSIGAKWLR
jgi:hypothetical protein